jgi:hypothetical protein
MEDTHFIKVSRINGCTHYKKLCGGDAVLGGLIDFVWTINIELVSCKRCKERAIQHGG